MAITLLGTGLLPGCVSRARRSTSIVRGEAQDSACQPLPELRQHLHAGDDGNPRLSLQRACRVERRTRRFQHTGSRRRDDLGGRLLLSAGLVTVGVAAIGLISTGLGAVANATESSSDGGGDFPTGTVATAGGVLVGAGLFAMAVGGDKVTATDSELTPEVTTRRAWLPEEPTTPIELETPWGARVPSQPDGGGVRFPIDWAQAGQLTRQQLAGIYKLHGGAARPVWIPSADDVARMEAALVSRR